MHNALLIEVRARRVPAASLDALRPLAARCGYRRTDNDLVRFAVQLAAELAKDDAVGGLLAAINRVSRVGQVTLPEPAADHVFP